ncbi:MAG: hypothetical protein HY298_23955 [Verrucomicrobia bacterium]|nr:hypothetical protein [Verrucomicrobiota bacterium]
MSLRLEMLQVARLAPKLLGDSTELVAKFLHGQQNADGGFKDRSGRSDLYYTVFGLDALLALQVELAVARVENYLQKFGAGDGLDFVHLCCLARAWAALGNSGAPVSRSGALAETMIHRVESFRARDGGYHPVAGSNSGTAYGGFLALGAYQDLKVELPEPLRLVQSLKFLEMPDGAWANDRNVKVGATNATAAALTILRNLTVPVNQSVGDWLLARCHPDGGFLAVPNAPIPDLLSTATALHALAGMEVSFAHVKEKCLDYIDTLWTNEGSFHGQWADDHLDTEYTFYGLLALGHLSL